MLKKSLKKKKEMTLIAVVIFQIFLLAMLVPANSYSINQITNSKNSISEKEKNDKHLLGNLGNFLINLISIKQIGTVSAETTYCCEKRKDGEGGGWCIAVDDSSKCDGEYGSSPTSCESTSYCKLGVCVYEETGECTSNSIKAACEEEGGIWEDGTSEEVDKCKTGCCTLNDGTEKKFVSKVKCDYLGGDSFDTSVAQGDCVISSQDMGACALDNNGCEFVTEETCDEYDGIYYHGYLCTHPDLNTICKKPEDKSDIETVCYEGRVHFIDSCQQIANVYDMNKWNKESYWETFMDPSSSSICGSDENEGNIKDDACGNCKYPYLSICTDADEVEDASPEQGNYICKDLSCGEVDGEVRNNAESWCVFENYVGTFTKETTPTNEGIELDTNDALGLRERQAIWKALVTLEHKFSSWENARDSKHQYPGGAMVSKWINWLEDSEENGGVGFTEGTGKAFMEKAIQEKTAILPENMSFSADTVGSSHWIKTCSNGEVITEPCGGNSYRGNICVDMTDEGSSFSEAKCVVNDGYECLRLNEELEPYEWTEKGESMINPEETKAKNKEICEENIDYPNCRLQSIATDYYFLFDVCVPEFPMGLGFWDTTEETMNGICSIATTTCTTTWERGFDRKWSCIGNCGCLSQEFANQMNDLCVSLGDCGGYINYNKDYTGSVKDGFETFDISVLEGTRPKHILKEYGQEFTADGDISEARKEIYEGIIGKTEDNRESNLPSLNAAQKAIIEEISAQIGETEKEFLSPWKLVGAGAAVAAAITGAIITTAIVAAVPGLTIAFSITAATLSAITGGLYTALTGTLAATAASTAPVPFIGWFIAAAAALTAAFIALWTFIGGVGDTKEVEVEFECNAWKAPQASEEQCELCNNDPDGLPCNEYRCHSLGEGCRIIGEDELYENETTVCYYAGEGDNTAPYIMKDSIEGDYQFITDNLPENVDLQIKKSNTECIQENSKISFKLKTTDGGGGEDEYAVCAYNWESVGVNPENNYENVPEVTDGEYFNGGRVFAKTHIFDKRLPGIDEAESVSGNPGNREGDLNMYVRCIDYGQGNDGAGNFNIEEYVINICITDRPDEEIATINKYLPSSGSYIPYGKNESSLQIYLSEPASCSWSEKDEGYEEMKPFTLCEDNYNKCSSGINCKCSTLLSELTQEENKIYIKCKDTNGNINLQSFEYIIKATQSPLEITSTSPEGKIKRGGTEGAVELTATTSGGAYNGKSICRYKFIRGSNFEGLGDEFYNTNSTNHKQVFTEGLPDGDYTILTECKDEADNKAQKNITFTLEVDDSPPVVVRAYKDGGNLKLITDENARCYYSFKDCNFGFDDEDVTSMTTALSKEHSAKWIGGKNYYVKCEDAWETRNSGCAIKISTA